MNRVHRIFRWLADIHPLDDAAKAAWMDAEPAMAAALEKLRATGSVLRGYEYERGVRMLGRASTLSRAAGWRQTA